MQAAHLLDRLTVETRGPSMSLALARTAASVQSHRRIRVGNHDVTRALPAETTPFMVSHGFASQAGPLEQAMMDRRVSDPALLLRASAIDDAACRLIMQAEGLRPDPEEADTRQSQQLPARGAAELAAQSFPQSPHTALSAETRHLRPGDSAVPALRTDQSRRGHARHSI
jgi:hypothetical protein